MGRWKEIFGRIGRGPKQPDVYKVLIGGNWTIDHLVTSESVGLVTQIKEIEVNATTQKGIEYIIRHVHGYVGWDVEIYGPPQSSPKYDKQDFDKVGEVVGRIGSGKIPPGKITATLHERELLMTKTYFTGRLTLGQVAEYLRRYQTEILEGDEKPHIATTRIPMVKFTEVRRDIYEKATKANLPFQEIQI